MGCRIQTITKPISHTTNQITKVVSQIENKHHFHTNFDVGALFGNNHKCIWAFNFHILYKCHYVVIISNGSQTINASECFKPENRNWIIYLWLCDNKWSMINYWYWYIHIWKILNCIYDNCVIFLYTINTVNAIEQFFASKDRQVAVIWLDDNFKWGWGAFTWNKQIEETSFFVKIVKWKMEIGEQNHKNMV